MILLAEPYIRFSRNLDPSLFPAISERLLQETEGIASATYGDLTTRVFIRLEQGSTRVWVSITSVVGALVFYGDIRQSIDYLVKDARAVSNAVVPMVKDEMGWSENSIRLKQSRSGVPGKLRRLFQDVRNGKLTPEEGTSQAVDLLYRVEGPGFETSAPNLAERIASEMHETALTRAHRGTRRRKRKLPPQDSPAPAPMLPSPRIGVIVSRDPLSGAVKISNY